MEHYGTVEAGDEYFIKRLSGDDWRASTAERKLAALYEASALLDTLSFTGSKTDDTQYLQFPRGGDTEVPTKVLYAVYEMADRLLGGLNVDFEADATVKKRTKFGMSEVEYENKLPALYKTAGIYSATVFRYIGAFLRNNHELLLKRVN